MPTRAAPHGANKHAQGSQAAARGGPFAVLNGASALDALCVVVSDNTELEAPVHVVYVSTTSAAAPGVPASAPRLYVAAGKGAKLRVIEEFLSVSVGGDGGGEGADAPLLTNAVAELHLAEGATVDLGYVQRECAGAYHMRSTLVAQAERSRFSLSEARLGGQLSRHDVVVEQTGPETRTEMAAFLLCGERQLHDLHSKLRLSHPRGEADQLHKCIVTDATGRGVFDGNVRVEREAQKTDAQQLSRNLLLVPKVCASCTACV